jgi:hypothetical protein
VIIWPIMARFDQATVPATRRIVAINTVRSSDDRGCRALRALP